MIKFNTTPQILSVKIFPEASESAAETVGNITGSTEISKAASESITALQQGIIKTKSKVLDRYSEASRFFGVDSAYNIMQKLENQVKLILMKCKEIGCIDTFPRGVGLLIDNPRSIDNVWTRIWMDGQIEGLYSKPARMTFYSKVFGENGKEGAHTIGLLYRPESKILYVLDSLPNSFKEIKKYQDIIKEIFKPWQNRGINILFSNKAQQNMNEYICNNWALANIEALQKALREGKTIDSVEKLNEVLPDDINKILKEQLEYVCKKSSF